VSRILPFDSALGAVFLACYEGQDPVPVTAEEAETLLRNQAESKSAARK
jgi:hypothetical protein